MRVVETRPRALRAAAPAPMRYRKPWAAKSTAAAAISAPAARSQARVTAAASNTAPTAANRQARPCAGGRSSSSPLLSSVIRGEPRDHNAPPAASSRPAATEVQRKRVIGWAATARFYSAGLGPSARLEPGRLVLRAVVGEQAAAVVLDGFDMHGAAPKAEQVLERVP